LRALPVGILRYGVHGTVELKDERPRRRLYLDAASAPNLHIFPSGELDKMDHSARGVRQIERDGIELGLRQMGIGLNGGKVLLFDVILVPSLENAPANES